MPQTERQAAVEEFLTTSEVAELFGVSDWTIYRWVKAGALPQPVRVSRRWVRFRRHEIEAAINRLQGNE